MVGAAEGLYNVAAGVSVVSPDGMGYSRARRDLDVISHERSRVAEISPLY